MTPHEGFACNRILVPRHWRPHILHCLLTLCDCTYSMCVELTRLDVSKNVISNLEGIGTHA